MTRLLLSVWAATSVALLPSARSVSAQAQPSQATQPTPVATPEREPPPVAKSLESLDGLLTGYLQSMPPGRDHPARPSAARALRAVTRLRELSVKWPAQSPLDYRTNLDRETRDLRTLLESPNLPRSSDIMTALAEDLETKLEHCTKSGGRLGGSVTVRVRTVQGGQEVRDWQVFYLPRVLDLLGDATPDRFPQLSSPTEERMVPGRYVMWTSDPASGRQSRKTVVKIGEGRQDLSVDLTVPRS